MKNLISIILLIFLSLIFSCSNPQYKIVTDCNCSKDYFIEEMRKALILNDFKITKDTMIFDFMATYYIKDEIRKLDGYMQFWYIKFKGNSVNAKFDYSKVTFYRNTRTIDLSNNYIGDKAPKDLLRYWNIRNSIDTLCKGRLRIIEFDPNKDEFIKMDSNVVVN